MRFHSILIFCVLVILAAAPASRAARQGPPNILFLIADDLGFGDLSCYGQKKFSTPNIDRLAAEGMKLTVHYSGSPVCAPSRCVLMTGKHPGHGFIRENRQNKPNEEGQLPVPPDTLSLPLTLKKLGYTTGAFGKWGLGAPGTTGEPLKQGIDRFFGYNCQAQAHNYYPTHLWDNDRKLPLDNPAFAAHQKLSADVDPNDPASYARYAGKTYAPDLIGVQALEFLRQNKERPFFLFFPTTVPHLALQVPEDSLKEFVGKFTEEPYPGGRGYLPHRYPRAAYAAMITRMDRAVGKLIDLVHELGLDDDTIIVFTSDNGPLYDRLGGTDADFFASAGAFRGRKGGVYEGGMRVPCLVRWKGKVAPAAQSDRITGFEDWLPTLLDLIGAKSSIPAGIDGISFAPTLRGQPQEPRPFLYRETPGYGGQQTIRVGDLKLVRQNLNPGPKKPLSPTAPELYDLKSDPSEATDLASKQPDVVARLLAQMNAQHDKSEVFPIRALDAGDKRP